MEKEYRKKRRDVEFQVFSFLTLTSINIQLKIHSFLECCSKLKKNLIFLILTSVNIKLKLLLSILVSMNINISEFDINKYIYIYFLIKFFLIFKEII